MEARRVACERTARFVSLDLDGELSRFERALLARHLARCTSCAADAQGIVALTKCLRAAPLEPLPAPVVITRLRRPVGRVARSAVAVAMLAVVGAWFGLTVSGRESGTGLVVTQGSTREAAVVASDGRYDWSAGLPRSQRVIQQIPGGLYTSRTDV